VPREQIFLTTKLWNDDSRRGTQAQAFEQSLDRLGLDYVDLYLIHWPVPGKYAESWKVLEKIYAGGRAKAVGVSNFHEHHLKDIESATGIVPAANQVECHPLLSQEPLRAYCASKGIAVTAWSPLGGQAQNLSADPLLTKIGKE